MHSTQAPPNLNLYADEHADLLRVVNKYDGAPAALKDAVDLLKSVQDELAIHRETLKKLTKKRKMEHKDYDTLLRSQVKQFFVRINHGGKEGLSKKLDKEEKEYIEALQNEHNEERIIGELEETEKAAKEQKAELEVQVAERSKYLVRLQEIYRSAFTGPTPDFPEEDDAEETLKQAEMLYNQLDADLGREKRVGALLDKAAQYAMASTNALQSANRAATFDTFGMGGIWAEMAERDDLLRAQSYAAQASVFLTQAKQLHSVVRHVPTGEIARPEWLNVVFDNFITDYMFQQKIQRSLDNAMAYQRGIFQEKERSQTRSASLQQPLADAKEYMQSCRRALAAVRREILTRLAEEAHDAPPTYTASAVTTPANDLLQQTGTVPINSEPSPSYYPPPPGPPPPLRSEHTQVSSNIDPISNIFASNNPFRDAYDP